jgi:23S rRNA (pseudouridine1915-N3)-methyltransferase
MMRLLIVAVGRLRGGPEAALVEDYLQRTQATGKRIGLQPVEIVEIEARPLGDARKEAAAILRVTPENAVRVLLDERGGEFSSRQLAGKLAAWRDQGRPCVSFWVGGPEGTAQTLKDAAAETWAFGRQTWPHRLVRAMLAEQLYRASTILSQTPYHRD